MGSTKHLCTSIAARETSDLSEKCIYQETLQTLRLSKSKSTQLVSQTTFSKEKQTKVTEQEKAVGCKQTAGTNTSCKKWELRVFWKGQHKQGKEPGGNNPAMAEKEAILSSFPV